MTVVSNLLNSYYLSEMNKLDAHDGGLSLKRTCPFSLTGLQNYTTPYEDGAVIHLCADYVIFTPARDSWFEPNLPRLIFTPHKNGISCFYLVH